MYKTAFLSLILGFGTQLILAQGIVESRIVDANGDGIPFAAIGIIEKNYGSITFEDGSFSLAVDSKYQADTLVISAIGYNRLKLAYQDFVYDKPSSISLNEDIRYLDEITITPERLKFSKLGVSKASSPNNYALNSPLDGASIVMLLDEINEPALIEEIAVTVGRQNVDSIQLRCRIYTVDEATGMPGRDLLKSNLIQTITEKQQRLTFNPLNDLWVDQPIFVGFEWVMSKRQFQQLEEAQNAFPVSFIDEIVAKNPSANWNLNENKRILFRDAENNIIKRVSLTKEQTEVLRERDAAAPKLQFKIKMKGEKTYYGSPITSDWGKIPHEALISIKVGKSSTPQIAKSPEETLSFMGKQIPVSEINHYLKKFMNTYEVPGLSVAIFDDKEVLFHSVEGYSDLATEKDVSPQTIFEGASLSKPLFAYMVMKYVEKGLIELDKPLHEYLPYEDISHDERYKKITARMVLDHTTGFPNWRTDHEGDLFISFKPGTQFQYSGEGYQYLAMVLASLLQTDLIGLENEYQKVIAQPLGLKVTKFVQDQYNLNNKATPHKNGKGRKQTYEPEFGAAFSIHTESRDFAKWLMVLLNEDELNHESYTELFADQIKLPNDSTSLNASAWTLGFAKYELDDEIYYGHGGNNYGFTSGFFIDRERKVGAVMFTNADQVSEFVVDFFLFLIEHE